MTMMQPVRSKLPGRRPKRYILVNAHGCMRCEMISNAETTLEHSIKPNLDIGSFLNIDGVNMSKFIKLPNIAPFFLIGLGLVFTVSCNNPGSNGGGGLVTHDGSDMTVALFSPEAITAFAIANLRAKLILDGTREYELSVDPTTNTISGTISNVSIGSHQIEIVYLVEMSGVDVILCQYSTQVDVAEGESTIVTFLDEDLDRNIDDDNDGHTNLGEVRSGTNPLSGLDFPEGGFSLIFAGEGNIQTSTAPNYTVKQIVGSTAIGTASSDNYVIVSSFIGSD